MSDIVAKRVKHISKLEAKLLEAKMRRSQLVAELRQAIEAAKPGDLASIAAQAPLNRALEVQERLLLSIEREIREARKQLEMAEAQQKNIARVKAAQEAEQLPKPNLFEIETPDHRRLRHRANSYAVLQRQLLPGYAVVGQVFGAADDDTGGVAADIAPRGPNILEGMLEAFGPSLKAWLRGQA